MQQTGATFFGDEVMSIELADLKHGLPEELASFQLMALSEPGLYVMRHIPVGSSERATFEEVLNRLVQEEKLKGWSWTGRLS